MVNGGAGPRGRVGPSGCGTLKPPGVMRWTSTEKVPTCDDTVRGPIRRSVWRMNRSSQRTSAWTVVMALLRAARTSDATSRVPTPRHCQASSTNTPRSAVLVEPKARVAMPMHDEQDQARSVSCSAGSPRRERA